MVLPINFKLPFFDFKLFSLFVHLLCYLSVNPSLFPLPLSGLSSGAPCLLITSVFLFHFLSSLPPFSYYRVPFSLVSQSSTIYISLVFLCILFHFVFWATLSSPFHHFSFLFFSLVYTVITTAWNSLVYLIIKLLIWIVSWILGNWSQRN